MQKLVVGGLISISSLLIFSCGSDPEPIDCEKSGPIISLGVVVDAASCSVSDGSIKVTGKGGKEPLTYSINDQPGQADGQFNSLSAGIYNLTVTDGNGCSASVGNVMVKAADFAFKTNITPNSSCLSGNGIVEIVISDGNPPYTYQEGTNAFGVANIFNGLTTGVHGFTIKDSQECSTSLTVTVPRTATGVSWEKDILPIINVSCAIPRCHDGSDRTDLRNYANAKLNAKSMKSKTQDRSMPREGDPLSQEKINLIACWVDDGALQN